MFNVAHTEHNTTVIIITAHNYYIQWNENRCGSYCYNSGIWGGPWAFWYYTTANHTATALSSQTSLSIPLSNLLLPSFFVFPSSLSFLFLLLRWTAKDKMERKDYVKSFLHKPQDECLCMLVAQWKPFFFLCFTSFRSRDKKIDFFKEHCSL